MSNAEQVGTFEVIAPTETYQAFIGVQTAVHAEARWSVGADGIATGVVDAGNYMMTHAELSAEAFEHYEADDGFYGIPLEKLSDYLGTKIAGDVAKVSLDPETRKVDIDVGPTTYQMALIDPDTVRKGPDEPDLDLPAEVTLDGDVLTSAIEAADLVTDAAAFTVDPATETLAIEGSGDTDSADTELGTDDLESVMWPSDPVMSLLSIEMLKSITGPIPPGGTVRLHLGNEMPCRLYYDALDGALSVRSLIAPRIESN